MNTDLTDIDLLRLSLVSDDPTLEMLGYMMYEKQKKDQEQRNVEIKINEEKLKQQKIEQEKTKLYEKIQENEKK